MKSEKPETLVQRENSKRKLVRKVLSIARNIVTYEVGLSVGVWELTKNLNWLAQQGISVHVPVLSKYEDQIRSLPSGAERLNCSREALRRYDEALLPINSEFHDRIIDACFEIIERLERDDLTPIRI